MTKARVKIQVHIYCIFPDSGIRRFLILRKPNSRGGFWQPVTGNVEPDEPLEECVRREVAEETGIQSLEQLDRIGEFQFAKNGQQFTESIFVAKGPVCEIHLSSEHIEHRWEPYETARELIHYGSNKEGLDKAVAWLQRTQQ